jgi:hypothetical protein
MSTPIKGCHRFRDAALNLIFMLTRNDRTVAHCLDVIDQALALGVNHVGFKDIGVSQDVQAELNRRIKAAGATSYLEVVSETPEACLASARAAVELGVDCLLGGTDIDAIGPVIETAVVGGSRIGYYPFVGFPVGHPTKLGGTPQDIADHCRAYMRRGAAGVDLLAYRATDSDPVDLVRAAREALPKGELIVAGSIDSPERVHLMAELGVDAITIGTAILDEVFAPDRPGVVGQLEAALEAIAPLPHL